MEEKKNSRAKSVLIAVGIFIIYLVTQTLTGAVGGMIGGAIAGLKGLDVKEFVIGLIPKLTFIASIITIIIFGIWYYFGFVKKDIKADKHESGITKMKDPGTIAFIVVLTLGMHFFVCLVGSLVGYLIPGSGEWLDSIMGMSVGENDIAGYLSIMLIAPISEEIAFRGVMLRKLKESFGFVGCVTVTTVLFGIMHLNPMQSIYVLPMGVMFAYVAYKYDSVIPAIIAHILNNCVGIILPGILGRNLKDLESAILFAIFISLSMIIGTRMSLIKLKKTA
jgi:membrane protease YdiL (CAAX protease family)